MSFQALLSSRRDRHVLDRSRRSKRQGGTRNDKGIASSHDNDSDDDDEAELNPVQDEYENESWNDEDDDEKKELILVGNGRSARHSVGAQSEPQQTRRRGTRRSQTNEYDNSLLQATNIGTKPSSNKGSRESPRNRKNKPLVDDSSESDDGELEVLDGKESDTEPPARAAHKRNKKQHDREVEARRPKQQARRARIDNRDSEDERNTNFYDDQKVRSLRTTKGTNGGNGVMEDHISEFEESDDDKQVPKALRRNSKARQAKAKATRGKSKAARSRKSSLSNDLKPAARGKGKIRKTVDLSDSDKGVRKRSSPTKASNGKSERRPTTRASEKNNSRQKQKSLPESDDDDSPYEEVGNQDSDSEESFLSQPASQTRNRKRPTKRESRARCRSDSADASDDDDEEDEEEEEEDRYASSEAENISNRRTTRSSPKTKIQAKRNTNKKTPSPNRSTPKRGSAARAKRKMAALSDSEESMKVLQKKRKNSASDDDFVDDQDDDGEDDELESELDETERSLTDESEPEFIESESGSESYHKVRKVKPSPKSQRRHSQQDESDPKARKAKLLLKSRRRRIQHVDDIEGNVESSSDDDIFEKTPQRKNSKQPASAVLDDESEEEEESLDDKPRHHHHVCPSKVDAITQDPLPSKHVCCYSPDGESRECFALETLRKVAMTSAIVTFREDFDGKQNFLQPPHFRTTMSDDLLDQIASRFGREALDIHGEFYKRSSTAQDNLQESHRGSDSDDDYMVHYPEVLMDDDEFVQRFRRYVSSRMGSQDIYACPLCYTEEHRILCGVDQDADKACESPAFLNFVHDPMSILGVLDNDSFALASTFCFVKVADLKVHLRQDHDVATQAIEGNELYSRFKIRGQGGLLQTFINKVNSRSRQGDMMRYWLHGNNQSFLLLLSQMRRRQTLWKILSKEDDGGLDPTRAQAKILWDEADAFFESLEGRDKRIWDVMSAPFRKVTEEEMDEFIADGSSEEVEDEGTHIALQHAMMKKEEEAFEEQMIEHLRRRRAEYGSDVDSDDGLNEDDDDEVVTVGDPDDDEDEGDNDDDEGEEDDDSRDLVDGDDSLRQGNFSEVSDDSEELGNRRRSRPRKGEKDNSHVLRPPSDNSSQVKRLDKGQSKIPPLAFNITGDRPADSTTTHSAAKAKRVIHESDEEDELEIVFHGKPNNKPASAEVVIVDSDEEM